MHLLIPFAFCSADDCAPALRALKLPHLEKLLARLTPQPLDAGDEFSLSPPHERALARALGLDVTDGLIPWAALDQPVGNGWGFITPCHWQVATNQITMGPLPLPDFTAAESQALLAAMKPYFEEDGIALHFDSPGRWRACGAMLADLPTASLDRVAGRNLENWIPRSPQAVHLRRLQNEMQMLLYNHPVNDARAARGVPVVNSFWLSGTGTLSPRTTATNATPPTVVNTLREPALQDNWSAWAQAWQALDATEGAALLAALNRGEPGQLTLCGERHAQTFTKQPQTLVTRFMNLFGTQPPSRLLEKL